ncbi:hypothetical protein Btru_003599 [Bulinus truncatus]|nr:hypothetical protein Btru_003599 [Bulinus truncatus]
MTRADQGSYLVTSPPSRPVGCLCKLSQDLEKKCASRLEGSTQDIPELRQILECLSAEDLLEAQLSGHVILHLVETGALDFTTALNSTLNTVPSSKNLVGSVETVCGLLVLQSLALTATGEKYRCPYALRHRVDRTGFTLKIFILDSPVRIDSSMVDLPVGMLSISCPANMSRTARINRYSYHRLPIIEKSVHVSSGFAAPDEGRSKNSTPSRQGMSL